MAPRTSALPLVAPLAGLLALAPDEADACSPDPCWDLQLVHAIDVPNAAAIPIDGALVLQISKDNLDNQQLMDGLVLEVTRDGQPIAGAVEDSGRVGILLWRPNQPFAPGAHQVVGSFDNPDLMGYDFCGEDVVAIDLGLVVEDVSVAPLTAPELTVEESVDLVEAESLDTLICCDGAFPATFDICGDYYVDWSEGECASTAGHGYLQVSVTATPTVPPATAGLLVTTLKVDGGVADTTLGGGVSARSDKAFCIEVEQVNLATGELVKTPEQCVGQDLVDKLGPQQIDAVAELLGKCSGPLYTCEVIGASFESRWDETQCTEVPSGATTGDSDSDGSGTTGDSTATGDASVTGTSASSATSDTSGVSAGNTGLDEGLAPHGCVCTSGPPDASAGLFGLVGLLALRRRRSR